MPGSTRVVVTGGGGFLGRYLIQTLMRRRVVSGRRIEAIAVLDAGRDTEYTCDTDIKVFPNRPPPPNQIGMEKYQGDITDRSLVTEVMRPRQKDQTVAVFHLASVLSAQGEANFDLCMSVNLDGTRNLLEVSREVLKQGSQKVKFIFPSSMAAFGPLQVVSDDTKLQPESTYGATKAIMELMVNEYSRKGWVDGRTGRLPTVIVRPGSPNGAATGCYSSIVRELLKGNPFDIPVDPHHVHPVCSIATVIKCMIALAESPEEALGVDRAVNIPALKVTMDDLLFHTQQIAQARGIPVGEARVKVDPVISKIIKAMPSVMHAPRAEKLGLPADGSVEEIVEAYVQEFLGDELQYPALGAPMWSR